MAKATKPSRAGRTKKVSVSLDRSDLALLVRRARRFHGGNLSAAIAEGARRLGEEEGREALVRWLGDAAKTTRSQRDAIVAEWLGPPRPRARRSAA